jgi:hypothetical protein
MSNRRYPYAFLFLYLSFFQRGYSQDSTLNSLIVLPDKLFASLDKKTTSIEAKLDEQTVKYLTKVQKQENKLKKKLLKKDSLLAKQLFSEVNDQYKSFQSLPSHVSKHFAVYSGHLDSLTTALNFLKNNHLSSIQDHPQLKRPCKTRRGCRESSIRQTRSFVEKEMEELTLCVLELKQEKL